MIEITDVVTLDDNNEYVVASIANYENNTYCLLVDLNDNSNLLFCRYDNGELVESVDKDLNTRLLPLFYENGKNILDKIKNNE